jgi:hypothetical protein
MCWMKNLRSAGSSATLMALKGPWYCGLGVYSKSTMSSETTSLQHGTRCNHVSHDGHCRLRGKRSLGYHPETGMDRKRAYRLMMRYPCPSIMYEIMKT